MPPPLAFFFEAKKPKCPHCRDKSFIQTIVPSSFPPPPLESNREILSGRNGTGLLGAKSIHIICLIRDRNLFRQQCIGRAWNKYWEGSRSTSTPVGIVRKGNLFRQLSIERAGNKSLGRKAVRKHTVRESGGSACSAGILLMKGCNVHAESARERDARRKGERTKRNYSLVRV